MNRVFVTGANGLLGTNLVLMLIEQDFEVTALVRHKKTFIKPGLKKLLLVEGDLHSIEKLTDQIKGCQYVVHVAANTSQRLLKLEDYYETNILGTQNIVTSCIENEIKKLIYIGTANTYGYGSLSDPGNENRPMKEPFTKSLYALSKNHTQQIIDRSASQLNITTISPAFMIGGFDSKPSSGRILTMALNKPFIFYPSGGKSFIHVSDVAHAVIKAFELDQSGEKYILAGENISYKVFYKKVISLNKQRSILIPIPDFVLQIFGLIGDIIRRLGIRTEISSFNMKALTVKNYYSNKKAKEALNINFTPIDTAIKDALEYLKNKGE
ncbi:MAG TPA: NAD-dependent epimerase/dehydratase family protein [Bacteroidales bacterium]|nr:NAD-dependent epimerase/dehydratase family protein [Bacteroidales bacterium]